MSPSAHQCCQGGLGLLQKKTNSTTLTAFQIYEDRRSKIEIMGEHYDTMQQYASHWKIHRTETMQRNKNFNSFRPPFVKVLIQYDSMYSEHLVRTTISKHRVIWNLPNAPRIRLAPYRAGSMRRNLKREKINKMHEAGAAVPSKRSRHYPSYF